MSPLCEREYGIVHTSSRARAGVLVGQPVITQIYSIRQQHGYRIYRVPARIASPVATTAMVADASPAMSARLLLSQPWLAENLPSLSSVRVLYSGTVSRVVLSTEFTTAASVPRFAYQSNGGGESKHCDARSRQSPQLSRRVTVHLRAISIFFLFNSGGARNYVGPNHKAQHK